jgi:phage-related protein
MAVNLGEVYATARLDTKKLHSDVNEAESKIHGFASGMGTALAWGAGVAGVAFAALGASFMQAVKDLGELDKLTKQVEAGIESTGGTAGVTADHVVELSDSLENLSSISQESILQGQNLLLTFTNIQNKAGEGNDIFDQASLAMTNMAAKMGTDAATAAMQLGKALNDPIQGVGALRRVGVQLSDEQEAQIRNFMAMGDVMGAQKVILAELNKEFGGAAEALGNSIPGAIALAKDAFQDFLRDGISPIGGAIKDISTDFIDMLRGFDPSLLTNAFSSISGVVSGFMPILGTIGSMFMEVFAKIGPVISSALERIAPIFDRILAAILPIMDPLMTIGEILMNSFLDVLEALMPVVEALAPILKTMFEHLAAAMEKAAPILAEIATKLGDILSRILQKMEPYLDKLLDLAVRILDAILPVLPQILDALIPILEILLKLVDPLLAILIKIEEIYAAVVEKVFAAISWLIDKLGGLFEWLGEWGGKVISFFGWLWDGVVAVWHAIVDPFVGLMKSIWEAVKTAFEAAWNAIKAVLEGIWNAIVASWHAIADPLIAVVGAIWDGISAAWNFVWGGISSVVSGIWNGISSAFHGVFDTLVGVVSAVWNGLDAAWDAVWSAAAGAVKGAINIVIDAINGLIAGMNAISGVIDWLIPGVEWGDIPSIPNVHTGSGVIPGLNEQLYMLLGGEMVMNRNAVAAWGPQLMAMNQGVAPRTGDTIITQNIYPQDDIDVDRALARLAWRLAG